MSDLSFDWCCRKDTADPLKAYRARFDIPEGVIYMDGNSLGVLPKNVKDRLSGVIQKEWGEGLVKSWNDADWINLPTKVGAKIAPLIGAHPHEVIMTDSTSINLFKLAAAACKLNPDRKQILSEPGNFPTDLYMLQGLTAFLEGDYKLQTVDRAAIIGAITDETAVVVLTQVHYISADMLDMQAITKAAHDKGALVVWDLSHSTGAVPVDLNAASADFAVGCGYKYLNGGPGAPAYLFVAERHQNKAQQPLTGWFGHKTPFDFVDDYQPTDGIKRMLVGTTGILGASALDSALDAFEGVDINAVRKKSLELTDLFIALVEKKLKGHDIKVATPREPHQRGSHVSLTHTDGYAVIQALIERGVIGDFRAPNFMRFGITPLYLGYADVFNAVDILSEVINSKLYERARFQNKGAVT